MGKKTTNTCREQEPGPELQEFNCFFKEMNDLYHEIARNIGVSDSVFDILYAIVSLGDGCLQRDICHMVFVPKQTVNTAIQKMKQERLISLEHGNRREMHIYLTERGKCFAKEQIAPVIAMENEVFEAMTEEERDEFLRLNRKYLQCFREKVKQFTGKGKK